MKLMDAEDSRLRAALGARGLAARLAASHFEGVGWIGLVLVRKWSAWS